MWSAEAHPSFDAAEPLADLERDGVYGAVLIGRIADIPNAIPADADIAYCQLANDWLADHWAPYLDRVAPGIHLPFKDIAACVTELERAASLGLRPALLPDGIFERPYHIAEWEPLWEAANNLHIPFTMHVGGLRQPLVGPRLMAYPGRRYQLVRPVLQHGRDSRLDDLQRRVRALPRSALYLHRGLRGLVGFRHPVLRSPFQPKPAT